VAEYRRIDRPRAGGADLSSFEAVHLTLRAGLEELAAVVTAWRPGRAPEPAAVHALWPHFATGLHHHHTGEDDIVWPELRKRSADFGPLEEQMRAEHGVLDGHLRAADAAFGAFAEAGDEPSAQRLAGVLAILEASLDDHLRTEEDTVLPLVNRLLSPSEWRPIDTRLLRRLPRRQLAVAVGAIDDAVRRTPGAAAALTPPPLPVRALLALSWRRRYARLVAPLRTPA
jgi:hemerythrin-like domain-containing protein